MLINAYNIGSSVKMLYYNLKICWFHLPSIQLLDTMEESRIDVLTLLGTIQSIAGQYRIKDVDDIVANIKKVFEKSFFNRNHSQQIDGIIRCMNIYEQFAGNYELENIIMNHIDKLNVINDHEKFKKQLLLCLSGLKRDLNGKTQDAVVAPRYRNIILAKAENSGFPSQKDTLSLIAVLDKYFKGQSKLKHGLYNLGGAFAEAYCSDNANAVQKYQDYFATAKGLGIPPDVLKETQFKTANDTKRQSYLTSSETSILKYINVRFHVKEENSCKEKREKPLKNNKVANVKMNISSKKRDKVNFNITMTDGQKEVRYLKTSSKSRQDLFATITNQYMTAKNKHISFGYIRSLIIDSLLRKPITTPESGHYQPKAVVHHLQLFINSINRDFKKYIIEDRELFVWNKLCRLEENYEWTVNIDAAYFD